VADKFATPSYTCDIAEWLRPLFLSSAPGGLFHLANGGGCSWREYGQWALDCCRAEGIAIRANEVGATTLAAMKNFIARRPVYSVLATTKYENLPGQAPRHWRDAVAEYVRDHVKARTLV
jgi:dTDP-4-dehydrorhamnose reductase